MDIKLVKNGQSSIGTTIRAVALAQSSRLFKSEINTQERSAFVFMVIRSEIGLALLDQGVGAEVIMQEIDPTDDILAQMVKDGYDLGLTQLLRQGVENG